MTTTLVDREHRFDADDIRNVKVFIQRSEEDGGQECECQLLDFSKQGAKLLLPISVRFQETIKLDVQIIDMNLSYSGLAQVRHIRAIEDTDDGVTRWQVGCSVRPMVSDEIIEKLATKFGKERRLHARIPIRGEGQFLRHGDSEAVSISLINISRGGFCIRGQHPYENGEKVKLEIRNKAGEPVFIDGIVRWHAKNSRGHYVGCSFTEPNSFRKMGECTLDIDFDRISRVKKRGLNILIVAVSLLLPSACLLLQQYSAVDRSELVAEVAPAEVDEAATEPEPETSKTEPATPSKFKHRFLKPDQVKLPAVASKEKESKSMPGKVETATASTEKALAVAAKPPVSKASNFDSAVTLPAPLQSDRPQKTKQAAIPAQGFNKLPFDPRKSGPMQSASWGNQHPSQYKMRMWTDDSGLYRVEAVFVKIEKESVVIRTFEDEIKSVPIERLSEEDRDYVDSLSQSTIKRILEPFAG